MTINSLILELQAIEKQHAFVVQKYQDSIIALKTKIHNSLMNTFNQSNLSEQKYILNRPHKWGELNLYKIHDLSTSQLFDKSGKFISYYNQIKLFDFHQTLNFISSFQELDIDFYNHPNFNEFFNDQNSFLILTAPDHDFDVNYIYEYVIISLSKDLKVLQNP